MQITGTLFSAGFFDVAVMEKTGFDARGNQFRDWHSLVPRYIARYSAIVPIAATAPHRIS